MIQKNNSSKRNFIPQQIGNTIKKINRKFSSKYGKIEFLIHSKWPEIAGSYFVEYSEPGNISRLVDYQNDLGETIYKNHLNVSVSPAAALEFQHFKDKILEKINSYFGYKAIIDLRIQQNYIPKANKSNKMYSRDLKNTEKLEISGEVGKLNDKNLQKSLIDLGENIAKKSDL